MQLYKYTIILHGKEKQNRHQKKILYTQLNLIGTK